MIMVKKNGSITISVIPLLTYYNFVNKYALFNFGLYIQYIQIYMVAFYKYPSIYVYIYIYIYI